MKTDFISLRLDTKTSPTVRKLIELRLVKTKTNAVKFIIKHGIMETTHIIEKKEERRRIIKKWKEEGFPVLSEDLSNISIKERE